MTPVLAAALAVVGVVFNSVISALIARAVASRTGAHTIFTVRANIRTAYRTRWLEDFRFCVAELLFRGHQIHRPLSDDPKSIGKDQRELRKCASKLMVMLGRERNSKGNPGLKYDLANLIRAYALAPNSADEHKLEELVQKVFAVQWMKISKETGEL